MYSTQYLIEDFSLLSNVNQRTNMPLKNHQLQECIELEYWVLWSVWVKWPLCPLDLMECDLVAENRQPFTVDQCQLPISVHTLNGRTTYTGN